MRVVVFGGGYAGIVAVKRLERRLPEDTAVKLVDRRSTHVVRHELHRIIRQPDVASNLEIPFESIRGRATFRHGTVSGIDTDAGTATFEDGDTLEFDAGIVAFGSSPADYGIEGVTEHGIPLDTLDDATSIAERAASILEQPDGRIVVAGAGLAGVQVAGELAERRSAVGSEDVAIELVEQADRVSPQESERFSSAVADRLRERGVALRTGTSVTRATEATVETTEETIDTDLLIWTGGITGPPPLDDERPRVRADLRLGERTFGAGDAISVIDQNGSMVAPTAQSAVAMAPVAADNAAKTIQSSNTGFGPRFDRYRDEAGGRFVTVGNEAVAQVGPAIFTGPTARTLKSVIGSRYLSTAGAIEDAVSLVRMEFDLAHPRTGAALPSP